MMPTPRVCVLRAPGTNCDIETAHAFDICGASAQRVHLFRVLDAPDTLAEFQVLCIPGGFSYGDDIGAGVIFSNQLRGHLGDAIHRFLQADKLVLGICNGFQVLLKSGILPYGPEKWPPSEKSESPATLTWNDNGKYTALWVHLECAAPNNVFLRGIDRIDLPIAHAEGKLAVRDKGLLAEWERSGQIAARYARRNGANDADQPVAEEEGGRVRSDSSTEGRYPILPYPDNPNGSVANIAGLSDPTGRVLGLMPHPERFIHATQHPQWTRLGLSGDGDGRRLFQNAVEYFR